MNAEFFQSPEIGSLTEAMIHFHKVCPKIPKDRRGARGKYADLSTVLDIVQPKLCDCGLNVFQLPVGEYGLTTILAHTSGEFIGSRYVMQPLEQTIDSKTNEKAITPQSLGAVITYQRRYALGAILNLNIDDDTDADVKEPEKPKVSAADLVKKPATTAAAKDPTADAKEATKETTTKLMNEGGGNTSQSESDPCGDQMAKQIKDALTSLEQQQKGVSADFVKRLKASGRQKIADLTLAEAKKVLKSIQEKDIVSFFEKQLTTSA
jgi:hypothetical protein